MIEVTDEMRDAYLHAWADSGCSIKAGLKAVLKIVNREHEKKIKAAYDEGWIKAVESLTE